jgi:hypothetical protein
VKRIFVRNLKGRIVGQFNKEEEKKNYGISGEGEVKYRSYAGRIYADEAKAYEAKLIKSAPHGSISWIIKQDFTENFTLSSAWTDVETEVGESKCLLHAKKTNSDLNFELFLNPPNSYNMEVE